MGVIVDFSDPVSLKHEFAVIIQVYNLAPS